MADVLLFVHTCSFLYLDRTYYGSYSKDSVTYSNYDVNKNCYLETVRRNKSIKKCLSRIAFSYLVMRE